MKLEGDLHEIELIDQLIQLARERFTGAIRFEYDAIIKIVYFKEGDLLSASTNDRGDSLDEILLKSGKVTREHVKQALAKRKDSETLGDALLTLGFITRRELVWARRAQLVGVLRSVILWAEGSYTIVHDYLPKREEGTLFSFAQVILEVMITSDDRERVERALEGGNAVLLKGEDAREAFRPLGLNEEAERIFQEIDGRKSAVALASLSSTDTFTTYKLLHALLRLGIIVTKPHVVPEVRREPDSPILELDLNPDTAQTIALDMPELELLREEALVAETPAAEPEPPAPAFEPLPEPQMRQTAENRAAREELLPLLDPAPAFEQEFPEPHGVSPLASSAPPPPRSRRGLAVAVLAIFVAGGGAFAAWQWRDVLFGGSSGTETAAFEASAVPALPVAAAPAPAVEAPSLAPPNIEGEVPLSEPEPAPAVEPPAKPSPSAAASATPAAKTAAPPPIASDDPLRREYDELARGYAAQPRGRFTVQFSLVCQTESVTRALASQDSRVWFVPVDFRGRPCYRLFWDSFDSRAAAERSIGEVPAALSEGSRPGVVEVGRVVER
jgi:septal ring-binding cell division protein DamX